MHDAPAVRKELEIRAPNASQLELRLHWFGRALEARCGYIVRIDRCQRGPEHVAAIAYEMPLPQYGRRGHGAATRSRRGAAKPSSAVGLAGGDERRSAPSA